MIPAEGIAINPHFKIDPPYYTNSSLNQFFIQNLKYNEEFSACRQFLGVLEMDFVNRDMLGWLLDFYGMAGGA